MIAIPYLLVFGRAAPRSSGRRLDDLERLVRLRDAGALTSEQFDAEKARLLTDRKP